MKKRLCYLMSFILSLGVVSQITAQTSEFLDINNVKARISANDDLFYDPSGASVGYEYPINSGKKTISSLALILQGIDANGNLKGFVSKIGSNQLHAGPIMNPLEYQASIINWDRVWKIDCATIQTFKDWYQSGIYDQVNGTTTQIDNYSGYRIPQEILDWPAHGDISKGQAWDMAPYFDRDGDGFYDPNSGDYPKIRGDQAIFFIYNDERASWITTPQRVEVKVMAYAFENGSDAALNNTIFVHYEIINRSDYKLEKVYVGIDADFDIGDPTDDYIGSDVARASFYGYNGDNMDRDWNTTLGYGSDLAAQSVVFLNGPYKDTDGFDNPITSSVQDAIDSNGYVYDYCGLGYGDGIIDNERLGLDNFIPYESVGISGHPTSALDYYNYSRGLWKHGSSLVHGGNGLQGSGGTVPTKYAFPGISDPLFFGTGGMPVTPFNWSEDNAGNPPGDKKGIGAMGPFTLEPGAVNHIDIALVSAIDYTGSGNQAPIAIMKERIDSVKSYYCEGLLSSRAAGDAVIRPSCATFDPSTGIDDYATPIELSYYPNPTQNNITFSFEEKWNEINIRITNLHGQQLLNQEFHNKKEIKIATRNFSKGIYFAWITTDDGQRTVKFMCE